jgi:hypothetical protein
LRKIICRAFFHFLESLASEEQDNLDKNERNSKCNKRHRKIDGQPKILAINIVGILSKFMDSKVLEKAVK